MCKMGSSDLASFASKLGLSSSVDRSPSGEPLPEEEGETTMVVASPVILAYGNSADAGPGSLYITTR